MLHKILCICLMIFAACTQHESESIMQGSSLPPESVSLINLAEFRPVQGSNWKIAGDVYANRHEDQHLEATEGTGILVNQPEANSDTNVDLFTTFEHGDIDLELDFLMPKGSNSGIYLQGRYEVQLLDSWLKDSLTYGDCGGIYQGAQDRFAGKAPAINAAKAPGLWQHLEVHFKAPRFDASGKKIANARFEEVYLNGELIQQQVAVSEPTVAAAFEDEKPLGPLMLQGDHGPVAFKNIRYKAYADDRIALKNMQYRVYDGMYKANLDTLSYLKPTKTGTTDTLSQKFSHEDDLLVIEGEMETPHEGDYMFELKAGGPAWLYIDAEKVTDNQGTREYEEGFYGSQHLEEGKHTFRVIYANYDESLTLSYEGPGIPWTEISTPASSRHKQKAELLAYKVEDVSLTLSGFLMHHGVKNPYAVSVGIPGGLNYAYDLKNYSLLSVWHGDFLDVGEMWINRGETQLEKPLGATVELSGKPAVALLSKMTTAWPDAISADGGNLTDRGYKLLKNGLPVFFYTLEDVQVEDYLRPSQDQTRLIREINFHFDQPERSLYFLLGRGSTIEKLPDGSYAMNGKSYYIDNIEAGESQPVIRQQDGHEELLLPVSAVNSTSTVTYSIIW